MGKGPTVFNDSKSSNEKYTYRTLQTNINTDGHRKSRPIEREGHSKASSGKKSV